MKDQLTDEGLNGLRSTVALLKTDIKCCTFLVESKFVYLPSIIFSFFCKNLHKSEKQVRNFRQTQGQDLQRVNWQFTFQY